MHPQMYTVSGNVTICIELYWQRTIQVYVYFNAYGIEIKHYFMQTTVFNDNYSTEQRGLVSEFIIETISLILLVRLIFFT